MVELRSREESGYDPEFQVVMNMRKRSGRVTVAPGTRASAAESERPDVRALDEMARFDLNRHRPELAQRALYPYVQLSCIK